MGEEGIVAQGEGGKLGRGGRRGDWRRRRRRRARRGKGKRTPFKQIHFNPISLINSAVPTGPAESLAFNAVS